VNFRIKLLLLTGVVLTGVSLSNLPAQASSSTYYDGSPSKFALTFLLFAVVLFAGKVGALAERVKQPALVGELIAGIVLSAFGYLGLTLVDDIRTSEIISFMAELGAVLLIFTVGLESNLKELRKVGISASLVSVTGFILSFGVIAFIVGPRLLTSAEPITLLFLGGALAATGIAITVGVFNATGILKSRAARIAVGAGVLDNILALILLSVVASIAVGNSVSSSTIIRLVLEVVLFLVLSMVLGSVFAKHISRLFSAIHSGVGMKLALAVVFALVFAYLGTLVGLVPIVGAFAAGLLLDSVHFQSFKGPVVATEIEKAMEDHNISHRAIKRILRDHKTTHVKDLIDNLSLIFVPIFFVFTGLQVQFDSLFQPKIYALLAILVIVAFMTKFISGFASIVGDTNEKLLIGMSMVPRGEVSLIFATTGRLLGVISAELFSVIVLLVVVNTFISQIGVKFLAGKLAVPKISNIRKSRINMKKPSKTKRPQSKSKLKSAKRISNKSRSR